MSDFSQNSIQARTRSPHALARQTKIQILGSTAIVGMALAIAGCGSNLRPTVTPIVGTGPASQPNSSAFVVSDPSSTAQGIGTVIDYAGDTVMATAPIGPGPVTFVFNGGGNTAWTLNVDGTVSNVPATATSLLARNIHFSTLNPLLAGNIDPVVALFSGTLGLYALDVNLNQVDVLSGAPDAFKLTVPVDVSPVTMVGVSGASRLYSISQTIPYLTPYTLPSGTAVDGGAACNVGSHAIAAGPTPVIGYADAIETATYTVSSHIPLGVCPVYAIGTPDTKRVFVLNRGSDSITVINSQNNALDECPVALVPVPPSTVPTVCPPPYNKNQNGQPITYHPVLPLSTASLTAANAPPNCVLAATPTCGLPAIAGPVYAEYNQTTGMLVVSNYDGNTINIIDVSLDEYGNDSSTFGTTYTVPVGNNPASVTVLADGSRAYVANQTDSTVSIVLMSSHSIETTLPVTGHPRTVVSTQNSNYGKVYVGATDSPYVTIIRTDQDIIATTVLVEGNTIDVRTSSPDTSSNNTNLVSRKPGGGQPCYLPLSELPAASITNATCKLQTAP